MIYPKETFKKKIYSSPNQIDKSIIFSTINKKFDLGYFKYIFIIIKNIILDFLLSLLPSLNYLFQARKFKKNNSSQGFSYFLCLTTLLSHTLKVFFWFGKRFKYTLLIQSLLVVIVQLYLIFLCIKFKNDANKILSDFAIKIIPFIKRIYFSIC